ncbi:MAG: asparagine synthase (glutamine-hydrolyzing) [Chloroflexota bacterium]
MCGICGTISQSTAADLAILKRMCATMTYRGPDEDGFFVDGGVGLGMRRLSVIDLNTGSQPIYNETGEIAIVFNGEIYNFEPLRDDLRARGHSFRTMTDTEVIVHGVEEYGLAFIERLNGMFALALWDSRERRLLLARDRTGQKPLFYYQAPSGDLVFGSEIPVLLAAGQVPRQVNDEAIWHYLSTQYVMGPATILRDVYQLPPGCIATWVDGALTVERYWSPTYDQKDTLPEAEWLAKTRETVTDAVRRHMIADVPLGAYLSGGVDSSIVVALMSQAAAGRVKTFSIGFDVDAYSETDHARRIAERFGTDHHEFVVSAEQVTNTLTDVIYHAGQPLADTSLMATFLLAKLTREHVTVALTGDGGDEAFAGYTRYTLDRALAAYRLLPRIIRTSWMPTIGGWLPYREDVPTDRNVVAGVRRLAQASTTTHKASILAWGSFFTDAAKHDLSTSAWRACFDPTPTPEQLAAVYDAVHASNHLERTLATDIMTYLANDLLVKADRMSMAHSLETRAPFLDNNVLALAERMPPHYKLRGLTQKWVLRKAFADLLPPENTKRVKRGFGMPVASWLRGHMAGYTRDVLLDGRTIERGYFERGAVAKLLDDHMTGTHDHGQRLWALLVLELWHRQFIDS